MSLRCYRQIGGEAKRQRGREAERQRGRWVSGVWCLVFSVLLIGCANRGVGPQGGPKDSIPPSVVMMIPESGATNFEAKRIELHFNEYLQLDNVAENVLMSPPTKQMPEIKLVGKKIYINFMDSLKDSTTYTIEFGNAICDFTEKIPLRGFSYSFSTGESIDSMEIRGRVVNSEDLNPISGIIVGLHENLQDSALASLRFDNIAKTDSSGSFVIHNVRAGHYRIYALGDVSKDYMYQPGEGLAFSDSVWETTLDIEEVQDTIWRDSLAVDSVAVDSVVVDTIRWMDTIISRTEINKGPNDVVLWYFKENKTRRYFQRAYRDEAHQLKFVFSGKQDERPQFQAIRPSAVDSSYRDSAFVDWIPYTRWSFNKTNDTVLVWLTDSIAIRQDSMFVAVTYERTDSVYNIERVTDTVRCIYRAPRLTEKMLENRRRQAENRRVEIKCSANGKYDLDKPVILTMSMPIDSIYNDSISLWQKIDTVYQQLTFDLIPLDSVGLSYEVAYPWKSEGTYELRFDSAAVRDIYGKVNKASKAQFSIRSVEDYATLTVTLVNYDQRMVVELLNEKGDRIQATGNRVDGQNGREEEGMIGSEASFLYKNLEPKSYYLRMFIDENGDSLWTTGDWLEKRQPEKVYYYDKKLQFKANWDFEEVWDYKALPQLEAKPSELRKDAGAKK